MRQVVEFARTVVLGYHRIGPPDLDIWSLNVTPERFEAHLERLRRLAEPRRLSAAIHRSPSVRPAFVVTFDDGYAETLEFAAPLLERYEIPATLFLPSGQLGGDREMFWDALERLFLAPGRLPSTLVVEVDGERLEWTIDDGGDVAAPGLPRHAGWRGWEPPPTPRHAACQELWRRLLPCREASRCAVLDQLFAATGRDLAPRSSRRLVDRTEAARLAAQPWFDLGAHSVTHACLAALPEVEQRAEIIDGKADLERLSGRPVETFAYPFGQREHYGAETVSLVREAGFVAACANFPGAIGAASDRFQIPRLQVEDWEADELARRLAAWLD